MVVGNPFLLVASICYLILVSYTAITGETPSEFSWYMNTITLTVVTFFTSVERK